MEKFEESLHHLLARVLFAKQLLRHHVEWLDYYIMVRDKGLLSRTM